MPIFHKLVWFFRDNILRCKTTPFTLSKTALFTATRFGASLIKCLFKWLWATAHPTPLFHGTSTQDTWIAALDCMWLRGSLILIASYLCRNWLQLKLLVGWHSFGMNQYIWMNRLTEWFSDSLICLFVEWISVFEWIGNKWLNDALT